MFRFGRAGESPFSMLGLGDIVIPGIFVAMCLRYDVEHGSSYFRRYPRLMCSRLNTRKHMLCLRSNRFARAG